MEAVQTFGRLLLYARSVARGLFWLLALGVLLYAPARYVYLNVPIMPFQPVCWNVNGFWADDRYVNIQGRPTEAFVVGIFDLATDWGFPVGISEGELKVPLYEWLSHSRTEGWDGFYRARRFYRFLNSKAVAWQLYGSLRQKGLMAPEELSGYVILDRSGTEDELRRLGASECGLMEEFVIEGGRFAGLVESRR